jgi:hypothetical protein
MKALNLALASAVLLAGTAAIAHPTDVYFDSRGQCQAAYAQQNQADRAILVQFGIAATLGEAMRDIHNRFSCEYDQQAGKWHFVDRFAATAADADDEE